VPQEAHLRYRLQEPTHDVEDGVEDLAQDVHPRSSGYAWGGKTRFYVGPFGIGKVGLVCSSHTRYSTELPSQDTFSDSFEGVFSEVRHSSGLLPMSIPN